MTDGNSMISLASLATAISRKDGTPARLADSSEGFDAHLRAGQGAVATRAAPAEDPAGELTNAEAITEAETGAGSPEAGNGPVTTGKSLPLSLPGFAATLEKLPGKIAADSLLPTAVLPTIDGEGGSKARSAVGKQDTAEDSAATAELTSANALAEVTTFAALPLVSSAMTVPADAATTPGAEGEKALPTQAKFALPLRVGSEAAGADAGGMNDSQQGSTAAAQPTRAPAGSASVSVAPEPLAQSGARLDLEDSSPIKIGERGAETAQKATTAAADVPATSVSLPASARLDAPSAAAPLPKLAVVQQAMMDLTQIVDRLSAAREALAPAAASLAINHAEFGELSLRFDQHRDGHLAVQIAAQNPEAHRAVAAVVGQQPFSANADHQAGQNAQSFSQSQSSMRDANGGANAGAGAGGGRENGTGTDGSAGREHPHQRRGLHAQTNTQKSDQGRAGIFA